LTVAEIPTNATVFGLRTLELMPNNLAAGFGRILVLVVRRAEAVGMTERRLEGDAASLPRRTDLMWALTLALARC